MKGDLPEAGFRPKNNFPVSPSSVQKTVARVIVVRIFLERELWGINEISFVRFVFNRALAGSLAKRMARNQKPSSSQALVPELKRRKARCLPSGEGMPQISVKRPGSRRRIVGLPPRST